MGLAPWKVCIYLTGQWLARPSNTPPSYGSFRNNLNQNACAESDGTLPRRYNRKFDILHLTTFHKPVLFKRGAQSNSQSRRDLLNHLQGGVGFGDLQYPVSTPTPDVKVNRTYEVNEVGLEPGTSLRSGLLGVIETAGRVVAGGRGVRGTIALTTGLDPDNLAEIRRVS